MAAFTKQRGGYRGYARQLIQSIEKLLSSASVDYNELLIDISELNRYKDNILKLDDLIQADMEEAEISADIQESSNRIKEIKLCLIKADIVADALKQGVSLGNDHKAPGIKLPSLNLPKFNGNILEWSHFWDIFRASVHSRINIPKAQKFSYLMGQLDGEAKRLLEGFTSSDVDYEEAIKLLEETYGDQSRIIQAHLHALFDLKSPLGTAEDLGRFRSQYESHIRALKTLKTSIEEGGFIVAAFLVRKLPNKIRDRISRAASKQVWDLKEFRSAINEEIKMLQASEPEEKFHIDKNKNTKEKIIQADPKEVISTVGNFAISANKNTLKSIGCRLCNQQDHQFFSCSLYETPAARGKRADELQLCHICLYSNHKTKQCWIKRKCHKCAGRHNTALCYRNAKNPQTEPEISVSAVAHTTSQVKSRGVALPTAMLSVKSNSGIHMIRALFDQGSQRTFMITDVAGSFGARRIGFINLAIDGFESKGESKNYELIQFDIVVKDKIITMEAILVNNLPSRLVIPGICEATEVLRKLGIKLADPEVQDKINDISLLVGADMYYRIVRGNETYGGINVVSSEVGKMITGPIPYYSCNVQDVSGVITVAKITEEPQDLLRDDLDKFWSLDAVGFDGGLLTKSDEQICNDFKKNLKFEDGRYTTRLPWKINHPPLKTNFYLARSRLGGVLNRLKKDENLSSYNAVIEDQIRRGFIEKVSTKNDFIPGSKTHYLAHHGVKKESTTTPLRIVFDCSAGKPSLNDCLHTGPSMVNDLLKVLLRFRNHQYACVSDIAKAYLMINLDPMDRNSTRFLWPIDPFVDQSDMEIYRFKRVLFGATCSQFLLNACIDYHLVQSGSVIAKKIRDNIYIDNLQVTSDYESELIDFYVGSVALMGCAGFDLREWITNSTKLRDVFIDKGEKLPNGDETKILGLRWNTASDTLAFPNNKIDAKANTMRKVLSSLASVFDPLGIISPVVVVGKIFMQRLWKEKLAWDDKFNSDLVSAWEVIAENLISAMKCTVPRRCIYGSKSELHAFSDASSKAYGASIYLTYDGRANLLISKSRVAPIKSLTIPQLELTAATVSARLVRYVLDTFKDEIVVRNIFMWTDSQIVLCWIKNNKDNLKPYVQRRVDEIGEILPEAVWKYVPTGDNPADLLSRGTTAHRLSQTRLWFEGPLWITDSHSWPAEEKTSVLFEKNDAEKSLILNIQTDPNFEEVVNIFRVEHFSSYERLLKITALVLRFIDNLKLHKQGKPLNLSVDMNNHNIALELIEKAENIHIKFAQSKDYSMAYYFLVAKNNDIQCKIPEIVQQLNLFLENGIIRCKGRLEHSSLNYDAKFPILLFHRNHLTKLIISHFHVRWFHAGPNAMIGHIRSRFWIPRLRQMVKSVRRDCTICRRLHATSYKIPPPAPLPADRIIESRPFSVTGVDYTGALAVKDGNTVRKAYIALFTCAGTRAIHLELVDDNSCESFLRAFRRFVGRRSLPRIMYSDNAKNFTSASDVLREWQNNKNVQDYLLKNRLSWKFIPARAPWFGGFWEKMIGLTKNAIKKILGRSMVTVDELRTIIVEVEMGLNDRPLTYVSEGEINDPVPLTPSQLLYGYRIGDLPVPFDVDDEDYHIDKEILNKRQRKCAKLLHQFWSRWHNEYLQSLRERQIMVTKRSGRKVIEVGDVVIIYEESSKINWKLGHILSLNDGIDGQVRSANLKTSHGMTCRPVARLYPLEINNKEFLKKEHVIVAKNTAAFGRNQREAARIARNTIAEQLNVE